MEDEELIVRIFSKVLARQGYQVLVASDGVQALEAFGPSGQGVDLVLLDRTLPRLNGEQVLAELRRRGPEVPVVVSTGDTAVGLGDLPGAVALLQKPYLPEQLLAVVREALDRRAPALT